MYLNKMKDRDIRSDADVQRLAGQWDKGMINELVVTVLNDDYIPPMILGEEKESQLWIIDGLQRSTSLHLFRYGNYKITPSVEDAVIVYNAKAKDKKGNATVDHNGDIVWEEAEFDLRNKTYDELPDELKKRFNEYQIETVIHEDCDMKRISQLIKRYNNHTAMNTTQKSFTYIDNFARNIRGIIENKFFVDCGSYTENDRKKGNLERVVMEAVMCMFHLESWKKTTRAIAAYLNKNATKEEFMRLNDNIRRLEKVVTEDVKGLFGVKDSFLWLTLFDKFTGLGLPDRAFLEFLRAFQGGLKDREVKGVTFDFAEKGKGTKDKAVVTAKLQILETLMKDFFQTGQATVDETEFLVRTVGIDETKLCQDLEFYCDSLDDLAERTIQIGSKLLEKENRPSLLAMVVYSYQEDQDLEEWLTEYAKKNRTYLPDQKENYIHMRTDLNRYLKRKEKRSA